MNRGVCACDLSCSTHVQPGRRSVPGARVRNVVHANEQKRFRRDEGEPIFGSVLCMLVVVLQRQPALWSEISRQTFRKVFSRSRAFLQSNSMYRIPRQIYWFLRNKRSWTQGIRIQEISSTLPCRSTFSLLDFHHVLYAVKAPRGCERC